MEYVGIIISLVALVGAGFAFLRATTSHRVLISRVEALREKNKELEAKLKKLEGGQGQGQGRGNRTAAATQETGGRNQPRQEQQQDQRQQDQRQQDHRQKQRERQQQQQQQQALTPPNAQPQEGLQQPQPRKKKENRRRNEPMERNTPREVTDEQPARAPRPIKLEIAEGNLLEELEQSSRETSPMAVTESAINYAIIPEDGVIRMHQLQQQPDSDSYLEVDVPADGTTTTRYRFNLAGNHAFVIAQGIDRLENAFSFEKPSNRMVSTVVQQQDGVLTKVNSGWKILEKARIDFR